MKFFKTPLNGAYVIDLEPFRDERGFFARTFCKNEFSSIGHLKEFVQFNHSMTRHKGTLRGMHYQVPPSAEIKLIRCISGEVFDVIIDIRKDSPTFLQHFNIILSDENLKMIYVPEGFAHGFQTLADNSQMIYHHTAYYTPANERGLRYDDPAFGIKWPVLPKNITDKDQNYPLINNNFKGIEV
jgi:dTDP-4-dehydrorhamnose 3,5-epimerase